MNERTNERTNEAPMSHPDPRGVLDDLADRRRRCASAITALATFYGLDPAPWLDETEHSQSASNGRIRATKTPTRDTKREKGETSRPPGAPSAQGDRILTALNAHGSPMSPGELATKLKLARPTLAYHVKALRTQGLVNATGATANRRISPA